MRTECMTAVETAIGRPINKAEAAGIEERVRSTMRRLASREPERWRTLPLAERMAEAGRVIAQDLQHAAQVRELRTALQIEAHSRHVPDIEKAGAKGFDVLQRKLQQADSYVRGVARQYWTQALDVLDHATRQTNGSLAARGVRWIAGLEDAGNVAAFVREVFGKDTGDAGAKAAAQAWVKMTDGMRERFNRAGGDVRKLMYGYLPQRHNVPAMVKAGLDRWVNDVRQLVDRGRYTDEAGRMLNDTELAAVLEQAWRDITTDGLASRPLGEFRGQGMLANANSQARALHFKGGDEYLQYMHGYGDGTVYDGMQSHVRSMARNIALVEEFGPSPAATFRTMHDTAKLGGGRDRVALLMTTQQMFDTLVGKYDAVHNPTAARIGQALRSIQVAGKLGQAVIGSISDMHWLMQTMAFHKQPWWQGPMRVVQAFGSDTRAFADRAGLMADSLISDMGRWGEQNLGRDWPDMAANATMKASFLVALTDATRRAFSISMMGGLARISRAAWDALERPDRSRLAGMGWTRDEWQALQRVPLERWRETDMLTPAAVMQAEGIEPAMRDRLISRLLGTIDDESKFASPDPNLKVRTVQTGGHAKGTGMGELHRSLMLFKGFSLSILLRHWDRVLNADLTPAQRLSYATGNLLMATLFGGISLQLADVIAGRDPRDATGDMGDSPERLARFWGAAMAKGGGLGFLGDMLLTGMGANGQSAATAAVGGVAGPVVGSAFELVYDVGLNNAMEAAQGKDSHAAAEAFRWARGHTPGANLWYLKLAIDQAFANQAQEFLSPGYLAKTQARMQRNYGSTWWWAPEDRGLLTGDMAGPERAPSFASVAGGQP